MKTIGISTGVVMVFALITDPAVKPAMKFTLKLMTQVHQAFNY